MQFTRLRLLGFKSFVDPTELVIAPGQTGVVGPNGCGKSNLLEALRWVMGENRASAMRGDGMEDVIFAGSGSRPQRNHAEVTLTLDNSDRLAPAGFNDDDRLEVVRRITREAGSAYRVNGKEARARDVQMLFADASTGAHSPALVRQGQITELINARPKARRRILEEAAGISGLYQRRHEAELKLRATEANLGRVGDVLEALDGQLATLARQARQAARYREVAEALRRAEGLLLWRLWHDAEAARGSAAEKLLAATRAAGAAQTEAAAAARVQAELEESLPALREEDTIAAAVLQRLTIEHDRLETELGAITRAIGESEAALAQIVRDREREAALDGDAAEMTARLNAERETLMAEGTGHDTAIATARSAAEDAAAALAALEAVFSSRAEAAATLAAEHGSGVRAVEDARRRLAEARRARDQAHEALSRLDAETAEAGAARDAAMARAEATAENAAQAEARLAAAEAQAVETRAAEAAARQARSEAEGEVRAMEAEVAGLEKLLARPADAAAQILDTIRVTPGYETAFGAALADDLALPDLGAGGSGTGWHLLPPLDAMPALPDGAEPLSGSVTAPQSLARRLAAIGVVAAEDGPVLQAALAPGQRLVSLAGDLWRWDGMRISAGDAPSTAALRLQQRNRLADLRTTAATAQAARDAAAAEAETRARAAREAAEAEATARAARKAADQLASEASRARDRAVSASEALQGRVAALRTGLERRAREAEEAQTALDAAEATLAALDDPGQARAAVEKEKLRVEAARIAMLSHRAAADEMERDGRARARRLAEIDRETATWAARQANAATRLADLDRRAATAGAALSEARARPEALRERIAEASSAMAEAESRKRRAGEALAGREADLRDRVAAARKTEQRAGEAREARARAEALAEAAQSRAAEATERLEAETGGDPEALLAGFGIEGAEVPPADRLEAEAGQFRRQRDAMGAVNLRAEEDAREVAAERDLLATERADLEEAIGKLRHGIANLNREGRGRLLAAFDEVNANFGTLFTHLFGGGEARLVLVESDDPLEAGLEIMCQPPGKKLSTLSLLSGGEQTLTALSLIFAVFLANPAPICVLDEVDAPLDDANVTRFCDLLDEMNRRTRTRFLIITHHAVTMARMDRLFGVTMAEQGVSQLVSVDLAAAEKIVEEAI